MTASLVTTAAPRPACTLFLFTHPNLPHPFSLLPCTRVYPSQIEIRAGEGGLRKDSVALGEQIRAISKARLAKQLGHLPVPAMAKLNAALKIALDLP
jgi:mRNA interferase MazF